MKGLPSLPLSVWPHLTLICGRHRQSINKCARLQHGGARLEEFYRVQAALSSHSIASSTTSLWFTKILSGHPAARSNKTVIAFHVPGGEHIL